jgi:hypothetical protein
VCACVVEKRGKDEKKKEREFEMDDELVSLKKTHKQST